MTALKPLHFSLLKRRSVSPRGMAVMQISHDSREFIEAECLDIYTTMVNSGASLQKTLSAIFLSGMSAAKAAEE